MALLLDKMGVGSVFCVTVPASLQALAVNSQIQFLLFVNPNANLPLFVHAYLLVRTRLEVVPIEHVIASDAKLLRATRTIQSSSICIAS